jgi:3-dehydroquinate dehydratase
VDEPNLSKAFFGRGLQVRVNDTRDVARSESVQIDRVLDLEHDRLVLVIAVIGRAHTYVQCRDGVRTVSVCPIEVGQTGKLANQKRVKAVFRRSKLDGVTGSR